MVNFTAENTSKEDQPFSTLLAFKLKDDADKEYDITIAADITIFETSNPDPVKPGAKATGDMAFEVPTTAKGLVVEYKPLLSEDVVRFKLDR